MKHAAITFDNDSLNTGKCILGPCWSSLTGVDQSKVAIFRGQCHFSSTFKHWLVSSAVHRWGEKNNARFSQQKYKKKKNVKVDDLTARGTWVCSYWHHQEGEDRRQVWMKIPQTHLHFFSNVPHLNLINAPHVPC